MLEMDNGRKGPRKMLNIGEVLQLVPVGKSTLFRMVNRGEFPKGHFISPNRRIWYEDELLLWQKSLPAESRRRKKAGKPPNS
jgi:predicted DNA-binding transcriptional regulator AlpA